MQDDKLESMEAIRKAVHAHLASLAPEEAKALRARFGVDKPTDTQDDELRAFARVLAGLKKK